MNARLSVSVAIPCYNGVAYVGRTIESVLAQSYPADEVLVIDDGSTDGSAAIIRQYPVRLVTHPENRGLSAARNTAIEESRSEILIYLDVDVLATPNLVKTLLSGYMNDPQLAGVGGQGVEAAIYSRSDRWRRAHASQSHGARAKDVPFLYGLCMSFRLSILRQIGGFREEFRTNAEDMDIGLHLTRSGYRLRYLPGAIVLHQRQDDEASLKRTMAAWYRAAYLAKQRNHAHPWTLFVGTLRRMLSDPVHDVVVERDLSLVPLSFEIGFIKLHALLKVVVQHRRLR